jgi:hypothetical protein
LKTSSEPKNLAESVNKHDKDNPDCDTGTNRGTGTASKPSRGGDQTDTGTASKVSKVKKEKKGKK